MTSNLPPNSECLRCGNVRSHCECPDATIQRKHEMDEDEWMEYLEDPI